MMEEMPQLFAFFPTSLLTLSSPRVDIFEDRNVSRRFGEWELIASEKKNASNFVSWSTFHMWVRLSVFGTHLRKVFSWWFTRLELKIGFVRSKSVFFSPFVMKSPLFSHLLWKKLIVTPPNVIISIIHNPPPSPPHIPNSDTFFVKKKRNLLYPVVQVNGSTGQATPKVKTEVIHGWHI